ncbi:MAG: peptidylprolyl isomerase [Candidatus Hydrothermarchaeales archaeon]
MRIIVAFIVLMLVAGCIGSETKTEITNNIDEKTFSSAEVLEEGSETMTDNPTAVILTNKGKFRFELYAKRASTTVANFIELVESGFYDGLTFHRYEPGFVIQGGDPRGDGTGGSAKTILLEVDPELKHVEGAVAMARAQDPNSASSQFYVTLAPAHMLDGKYAVFGKVTEGMDIVKSLRAGDKMEKVTIEQ